MADISRTSFFNLTASPPELGLVLMFDLDGFSKFFSQPDVHLYVPKYINRIFEAMSIVIYGGVSYWKDNEKLHPFIEPAQWKYMGDGALYIWTLKDIEQSNKDILFFINKLWNIKNYFHNIIQRCSEDVPVVDFPKRIRFGLAAGSIYKLTYTQSSAVEYIGYCINLASRLQSYCRELGFIASARLGLPKGELARHGYMKVVAKKLRGFPKEIVIVDEKEFADLDQSTRNDLFEEL